MKTTMDDEKVKDKIGEDDKKKILDKCDEAIKWLDANQLAEVRSLDKTQPYSKLIHSLLRLISIIK